VTSPTPAQRPSRRWLETALVLYWPAAYLGIYLPLIAPYEAWRAGAACFVILACLYVVGLAIVGWSAPTVEVLLTSVAITIAVALFSALASRANSPGFHKGPADLSEALRYALPLGSLAGVAMLAAKAANLLLRRRGMKSAA